MSLRAAIRLMRRGPGRWLVAASLGGWALLATLSLAPGHLGPLVALCSGALVRLDAEGAILQGHAPGLGAWLAMLLAMQPLLLWPQVAMLQRANLPRLRRAALAAFLVAHALPWLALGLAWLALAHVGHPPAALLGAGLALVLVWHGAPLRQRWLNRCHRLPSLRPFGRAMLADTARYGLRQGLLCAGVCGPAMALAMSLPAGHLPAMAVLSLLLTAERLAPARHPGWRLPHPLPLSPRPT